MKTEPKATTKVHRDINPVHFLLHCITMCFTLAMAVVLDVVVVRWINDKPEVVRWQSAVDQRDFRHLKYELPGPTNKMELGFKEDGTVVWRLGK